MSDLHNGAMSCSETDGKADRLYALAPLTLIEQTPPQLVQTAALAGYDAVGLRLSPFRAGEMQHPMLADTCGGIATESPMMRETLAVLRDTGLQVLDIEVLLLTETRTITDFIPVLEAGARLGAKNALVLIDMQDQGRAAEKFAALCALAAPLGIWCNLEFAAWLGVGRFALAHAVVQNAGAPNGALLMDPFHLFRSGGNVAEVAAVVRQDAGKFRYAQFCDAPLQAPEKSALISEEARFQRQNPGAGGLPLADFLQALPPGIPLGLEIPDRALALTMTPLERVRNALISAKKLVGMTREVRMIMGS